MVELSTFAFYRTQTTGVKVEQPFSEFIARSVLCACSSEAHRGGTADVGLCGDELHQIEGDVLIPPRADECGRCIGCVLHRSDLDGNVCDTAHDVVVHGLA